MRTRGWGYPLDNYLDFFLAGDFFAFLPSLARRAAVRTLAAAADAILARFDRSSGVIVWRLRFPPLAPISAITRRTSSLDNLTIRKIIPHRLGGGGDEATAGIDCLIA